MSDILAAHWGGTDPAHLHCVDDVSWETRSWPDGSATLYVISRTTARCVLIVHLEPGDKDRLRELIR